jgi:hypothetical protein
MTDRRDPVFKSSSLLNQVRRMAFSFLTAVLAATQPTGVFAQTEKLVGEWQQLSSNAGACPHCRVTFAGDGQRFRVMANNGWSANVEIRDAGSAAHASGSGQWQPRSSGAAPWLPFSVDFTLQDQRLHMTMTGEDQNGRKRVIKAVFSRVWFGA